MSATGDSMMTPDKALAADLEETAELPMLSAVGSPPIVEDPNSSTDAWKAPAALRSTAVSAGSAANLDATDIAPAPPTLQMAAEPSLEQRLREAEIGALRSDLASVTESRGQLEGNLGKLTANLRELESMLNRKSEQLSMFEREVGQRDRRITELESQLATLTGEHVAASAERDKLGVELKAAREDAAAARALAQTQGATSSARLAEQEAQIRRLRTLEADLAQARAHSERYREALQSLEGRRQIFDSMLGDREAVISERGARLAQLERDLAERTRLGVAREEELMAKLKSEQTRVQQLQDAAIAQRAAQDSQAAAAQLELKAAQERQAALEAEVKAQAASITQLRSELGSVRESLEERNALISRLETETASSAAVLGSIQHNLEHLGAAEPTRMLVRTQGETGIVQILGRRTTIGRTPDNDIRIDADFISRHHAVVLLTGAKTVIEDLNSTNGTYVNGERVTRRTIKEGDLVTLGKTEFRFVLRAPPDRVA